MAEPQPTPEAHMGAQPQKGASLFGRIVIVVFMAVVIMTECLMAYFWIPSADEVASKVEAKMTEKIHKQVGDDLTTETEPVIEFDLGEYSITAHQPRSNSSLRIDFQLFGTVLEEHGDRIQKLFDRNQHRFRDQILFEIRNSEITDLSDPGLGLIKRRILEKSNRLFGEPILRSVVFSNFSFIEQ